MRRAPRILGMIFVVVGIGLQGAAGIVAVRAQQFLQRSVETTGTVIDLDRRTSSKGATYAERVRFKTADGAEHEFTSRFSSSHPFKRGATVPVRFDPSDASTAYVATTFRTWFGPGLLGGMGIVFCAIGLAIQFGGKKA